MRVMFKFNTYYPKSTGIADCACELSIANPLHSALHHRNLKLLEKFPLVCLGAPCLVPSMPNASVSAVLIPIFLAGYTLGVFFKDFNCDANSL
jgi:hypothetical protein